ncbi:pectate lyase [Curtobacterium flaccumfaciens pv. flaccumfaciens]|uniref:pectate lyase n=1 Tax=Curtobacterium TaxID=2034 RepID=UPI00217E5435|nr:pectate lyase [Curtobacterium flaccumfaciens]MCS6553337.1 pectate lyase [Curtobacterium flaccumfaciens pv. flaccumfaciens]MCS6567157.1 pectate lyase [Curtobacterium flaccumfaciens pv. flaccumfaciens]MCS6570413.1 pectate lyase [Curtobacterium flaccumfaciens pv. flaccumfaciens]MCS6586903.1 pectate lyase [Curtobacterium flaccumfaciens pv. flaccumfaciens]
MASWKCRTSTAWLLIRSIRNTRLSASKMATLSFSPWSSAGWTRRSTYAAAATAAFLCTLLTGSVPVIAASSIDGTAGANFNAPAGFPKPTRNLPRAVQPLRIPAGTTIDFHDAAISGTTSGSSEYQLPVVIVEPGATVKNLIVEAPAADGVHCQATCTLDSVWFPNVGEDAGTLEDGSSANSVMTIDGGGARHAHDKVFQIDGAGSVIVRNFSADDVGTLIRSCGNCLHQYPRHIEVINSLIRDGHYHVGGININYGDTAKFANITVIGNRLPLCQESLGSKGGKATFLPYKGPDKYCQYDPATIINAY